MTHGDAARILVVDDEPSVLETMAAILTQEGYQVATADSAESALVALRSAPFELVLSDLRMEGASGISLLAQLRTNWPQTTAIILTGYASLESAIDALREGAYDYLIKPCDVEELKATIARAVERGDLIHALQEQLEELETANATIRGFADELQGRVDAATAELSRKLDELGEAKRGLEHAQREREQFISMVVHELNQPLTKIGGYAQLLARPNLSVEAEERARATILDETRRLTRLVQDLADASHLASGRFSVERQPCSLSQIVRKQVERARMSADGHAISLDLTEPSVLLDCDEDRIEQVLSNLLTNAIKYTPAGKIQVRLGTEAEQALLSVRDEGPGILADRLEAIFEPHVRLGGSGEPKGSGLGLYIARGIVEAHGGRIWAESAERGGTTFTICLPFGSPRPAGQEGDRLDG